MKFKTQGFLLVIGLLGLVVSNLYSARPYATDDPFPVEEGVVEFETGVDFDLSSDEPLHNAPYYFSIRSGLSKRFDLAMAVVFEPAVSPLQLQSKIILWESDVNHLSMTISWSGGGIPDFNFIYGATLNVGDFYYNSGFTPGEMIFQGLTYQRTLGKFLLGGEVTLNYDLNNKESEISALLGVNFYPVDTLSIDIGVGRDFKNSSFTVTTGIIWDF